MTRWIDLLSSIPIFSFLSRSELEAIDSEFVEVSYGKGETICRIGEPGNTFYVVLSGELEVWGGSDGTVRTGTLRGRDFFGEMALLQGGRRGATVTVARRARLLAMERPAFERVFLRNPKAVEYFARVLCKRLASLTRGEGPQHRTMGISVAAGAGLKGTSYVASALAGILKDLTGAGVLLVRVEPRAAGTEGADVDLLLSDEMTDIPPGLLERLLANPAEPATLHIQANPDTSKEQCGIRASNLIARVGDHFPFVVFDLSDRLPALIESASEFSDALIDITDDPRKTPRANPGAAMGLFQVVNLYNRSSVRLPINRCEPYVLPIAPTPAGDPDAAATHVRRHPRSRAALPIHRLARRLLKSSVGIALGGGAAFGISHLGVLKVLEANGIPIDMVAGCSQGSIIGVGLAAGISTDEMIGIARRLGRMKNFFTAMDVTITKPGILAGNRIIEIFSPLLGDRKTFEDLVMPCRTIATDIESGERVAIGTGRLDHAFRASSAVPMVMSPLKWQGRALVDGGVVDPVPAEIVHQMGADVCIAVNVVPPMKKGVENVVSKAYRRLNSLNPLSYFGDSRDLPNLFDIVMNAMQILQYELGNFKAINADVLINPDLSDFTWIEYYRSEELIDRGIEAAERALPAIRKVLDEKMLPYRKRDDADTSVEAS